MHREFGCTRLKSAKKLSKIPVFGQRSGRQPCFHTHTRTESFIARTTINDAQFGSAVRVVLRERFLKISWGGGDRFSTKNKTFRVHCESSWCANHAFDGLTVSSSWAAFSRNKIHLLEFDEKIDETVILLLFIRTSARVDRGGGFIFFDLFSIPWVSELRKYLILALCAKLLNENHVYRWRSIFSDHFHMEFYRGCRTASRVFNPSSGRRWIGLWISAPSIRMYAAENS